MIEENNIKLKDKFPEMIPVDKAPILGTLNGCGCNMYGNRDFDHETNTYVSTLCICLLFIPIIPLVAYRVSKAENGWYFIGKEPLSSFAKLWNNIIFMVAIIMCGVISWGMYTNSQSYKDSQTLKKAQEFEQAGKINRSVIFYTRLYLNSSEQKGAAEKALKNIYDLCKNKEAGKESLILLKSLIPVQNKTHGKLFPDMQEFVFKKAKKCLDKNPVLGLEYLKLARKLHSDKSKLAKLYQQMLEKCVADNPQNLDAVLQLANIYESENKFDKCEEILMPVKDKIASTEGANILGKIMLQKKNYEEAYKLLEPYVKAKRKEMFKAKDNYVKVLEQADKKALDRLNSNPDSKAYKELSRITNKSMQEKKVDEYILKQIKKNSRVKKALNKYLNAASFVPSAIDLGILQLERARTLESPEAKKKELEAAEQTFVSIASFASDSDEYKLSLGEIYYWLGKDADGSIQFENYLLSQKRNTKALFYVAEIYRRIGKTEKVYKLAKEIFDKKGVSSIDKDQAIFLLSQTCISAAERVSWLEKLDKKNQGMRVSLYSAKANLAINNGDDKKAQKYLKKSIAIYEKIPESATVLNNLSLVYSSLYKVTGNPEDFAKSVKMMLKAVELDPRDALLMLNAIDSLLKSSVIKVISGKVDLRKLKNMANSDILDYFYSDKIGKKALFKAIRETDSYKKAVEFNKHLYLLAPKNINVYFSGLELARYLDSQSQLKTVKDIEVMLKKSSPDISNLKSYTMDIYSGKKDEEMLKSLKGSLTKYRLLLKNLLPEKNSLCYSIVATIVARLERNLNKYEPRNNQDTILLLTENAFNNFPSAGTIEAYINALSYGILKKWTKTNADLKKISIKAKRCLDSYNLIAYIFVLKPEIAKKLASDPNLKKILQLLHKRYDMFSGNFSVQDWAVARLLEPKFASKIKDSIVKNKVRLIRYRISYDYFSYIVTAQLDEYLLKIMTGKTEDAKKVLQKVKAEHSPFFRF